MNTTVLPHRLRPSVNEHIAHLLVDFNGRMMKRYGKRRRALFDEIGRCWHPAQ